MGGIPRHKDREAKRRARSFLRHRQEVKNYNLDRGADYSPRLPHPSASGGLQSAPLWRTAAASVRANPPRRSTTTESNPNHAAIVHSSAASASATATGSAPVSIYAASVSSRRAARSALRSTRATRRSPSRNGST